MRLFLALDLPHSLRSALAALRADIPGARWVPADTLHVTLYFLGEVAPEKAAALAADVQQLAFEAVPLVPIERTVFPDLRRPRVLVVRLRPNAAFETLYKAAASLIAPYGFTLDARPFTPHVTLARLKKPEASALQASVQQRAALPDASGRRVTLYESALEQRGARYQPLATAHAR